MAHIKKKQEEWNQQKVKELLRLPENKKCFDCPTKSPFFVNMSIQTFVCTRCSGLVREVGHRVKSISASEFSGPEVVALQHGGNEVARSIWLSTYSMVNSGEPESDNDVRLFMRQKYYEQKWLSREKAIAHAEKVKILIKSMFAEDGTRYNNTASKRNNVNKPKIMVPEKALDTDNVPIGLIISSENNDLYSLNNNMLLSPKLHNPLINNNSISIKSPSTSTPSNIKLKKENDILSKPTILSPSITPSPSITASKTYTGGILQPNNSLDNSNNNNTINLSAKSSSSNDLYAALRNLSIGNNNTTTVKNKDLISFEGTFNKSKNTVALLRDLDPLFNKQSNDS